MNHKVQIVEYSDHLEFHYVMKLSDDGDHLLLLLIVTRDR